MEKKTPTYGNGKICYLEIPATDTGISASFYGNSFGWQIRRNTEGEWAFDDGVGEVSGMWVLNRKPMEEAGIIISIMVDDAVATSERIVANGGKIIHSEKMSSGEVIMHFRDPAGNFMGLYEPVKH